MVRSLATYIYKTDLSTASVDRLLNALYHTAPYLWGGEDPGVTPTPPDTLPDKSEIKRISPEELAVLIARTDKLDAARAQRRNARDIKNLDRDSPVESTAE
jgi:hypothetical protein